MEERLRRLAENDDLASRADPARPDALQELVCECTDLACRDILRLTAAEYARVRASVGCFVVMPGHEDANVEQVVESHPRYRVVEPGLPLRGLRD